MDVEEMHKDLRAVQAAAAPLKDEKNLFYEDKFRDFILDYIKPPKIQMMELDGRNVLEVTGVKIVLGDVVQEELFKEILNDKSCEEVRFVGGKSVHVNENFTDLSWRGKNIVVLTKNICVHEKVVWNVSGRDSTRIYESNAGKLSDGTGKQGSDGEAGESGGNILVLSNTMLDPQNLTILSNGGKGGDGQDGGDGENGQDGKGITKEEFNDKFPPASKFQILPRLKNIKTTLISIESLGNITYKWYERPGSKVSKWVPFGTLYKNVIASDAYCFENNFDSIMEDLNYSIDNIMDNHNMFNGNIFVQAASQEGNKVEFSFQRHRDTVMCQSYLLFKGAPGKPGSKGGVPGLGGQGGFGGEVVIRNPNDVIMSFNVMIQALTGADGENGRGGRYGRFGKTGCDMGYLDYQWSEFGGTSKWPKLYGQDENSTIELKYQDSSSTYNVWSPYRRYKKEDCKYVGMGCSVLENHKSRQFDERATIVENQERRGDAKATKKKTISQAGILSEYQTLLGPSKTASLEHLLGQIDGTNRDLSQAIALTTSKTNEMSKRTESTRCTTYTGKKKPTKPQENPRPNPPFQTETKSILIQDLKGKPFMPLVAWAVLGTFHLIKEETVSLAFTFNSLYPTSDSDKIKNIRKMFVEKYRFAVLNDISKLLLDNSREVTAGSIDALKVIKYLEVIETDDGSVSHTELGTLGQFLYINKEEERKKLAHYVKHSLHFEKGFLIVFRSFVLALGNSTWSSENLKACFNDYNTFLKKKEQGFIIFPESLNRIDCRHSKNDEIIRDIRNYIKREGCLTLPCIQLLAHIFNVNIRLYKESRSEYKSYYLEASYNAMRGQANNNVLHFLLQSEKIKRMQVDWEYFKLEKRREMLGAQCKNVLCDAMRLDSWESLEKYYASQKFLEESYCDDFEDDEDLTTPRRRKADDTITLNEILGKFDNKEDKELLGTRLSKISRYIPGNVVENMHKKFLYEGRTISVQELCSLINVVIMSFAEGNSSYDIYRWIISAYPQDQWINQVLLMDVEMFLKKSLPLGLRDKWEGYLSKIKNKRILIQLQEKLETNYMDSDSEQCVEDVLHMLSEIPGEFHPGELGLAEWPSALKEKYWSFKLTEIREWNDPVELSTHSYYLLSIENNHGDQLVLKLLDSLILRKQQVTLEMLTTILSCFYDETWDLSHNDLDMLKNSRDVGRWVESMKIKFHVDGKERDLQRICELVGSNANTSETVKILLPTIVNGFINHAGLTNSRGFESYNLTQAENYSRAIRDYNESDIDSWLKAFLGALKSAENGVNKIESHIDIWVEMLDVVDTAVYLKRGFRLRDTQKLAVMILLKNKNSTLAQVATGEGKSLIVVAVAIIESLIGGQVDIITSSSVLAKRDAENNQDLYNMFGISVSHNCSKDLEVRKAAYSGNQVVYGDLSDFQRDYLLHQFYNMNVLGHRKFETVVVDEVDSMLLDKGNNMLYLSHNIPGLDKLESVYLFIWQWVGSPCGDRWDILSSMNIETIRDAVIYDLYGTIKIEDVKAIDIQLTDAQARTIWENMKSSGIIDDHSRLKIEEVNRSTIEKLLSPNFSQYNDRLCYLIDECINRDRRIHIPNCLQNFVDLHLDRWISNAINAFFMKNGEDYVVDVDRTGTSPDRNPNITIIDKDTGTDQSNSQWDEALHQFLQLKHGCKVSMLSLKAVFISNVSYFKQYDHLYGLTGTLGSKGERKLLEDVHNVDFVTIPTAKPKQFHEYLPKICYSEAEWKEHIRAVALDFAFKKNRSVLIVCNSVNDVESLQQAFGGKGATGVHTYARDYEEFDVAKSKQELRSEHIIIATNLAGRGTDIKISEELKRAGGLHVIVAYLPKNTRIEQQAFGRAARCGEKGSGQLIIPITDRKESIVQNLKNKRDNEELERISEIKSFYENNIKVEEMCFGKFKERFTELKKSIDTANHQPSLIQSATKIITAEGEGEVIEGLKSMGQSAVNIGKSAIRIDTSVVPKKVEDILLKSCINKWAFWLDQNGKLVKDWKNPSSRKSLNSSLNEFLSQMKNLRFEDSKDWAEWLGGNPVAMVELAKHFQQNKNYDAALEVLDKVISEEPHFSEAAHYYKAATLGCKIDWESKPSDSDDDVKIMRAELLCAEKLFERISCNAMNKAAVVGGMMHENKHSLLQVDAYEEQQKNIANLCRFFSGSIRDILGHPVTPESFSSWNVDDKKAETLYKLFIFSGILSAPRVAIENMSETDLDTLCCGYDIPSSTLKNFLKQHDGKVIQSYKQFINELKTKIQLPSKGAFWKELVKMNILLKEVKYVIVKLDKLAEVDESLLDSVSGVNCGIKQCILEKAENQIFLNSEQVEEQMKNIKVYEKVDFIKNVGRKRYDSLKEKEALAFNRRCDFQLDALKLAANSQPDSFTERDLIAITTEEERKAIITELCGSYVIVEEPQGNFRVVVDADAIEKLHLPNAKVKALLKKCSNDLRFWLANYDSISAMDLIRNRVSQDDALTILQELEQANVIKIIPGSENYRLTTHYSKIDGIRLKIPIYENVTKSVLKMSFSYRVALQTLVSRLEKGDSAKISCMRLQTKPHVALFWSLYDLQVINASKVRIGVSKQDIINTISTLKKELLEKILANNGCMTNDEIGGLIENLTTKNWLIFSSSGFKAEKDKGKRKSLDESYSYCQKTIARTIDDLVYLADETTIATVEKALDRMKITLKSLDVPSFGFKPLSEAMAEGDFSMVQELSCFMLSGLSELMVLEEKPYTFKFWVNVTCVVLLGICQITVGAIIDFYSAGAMTHVGNAFMSEGISDIMHAIGAMRTGYFSWKNYRRHKIESVALTIVTAGVGAYWSRGTKFSRVGQKTNPTGLTFGGNKITEETGSLIFKRANESLTMHVLKTATQKTFEATVFGAANTYIDSAVDNYLQGLGKALATQILADIDEEVRNHKITDCLERAFKIKGESHARIMVRDLTEQYFAKSSEWETMCSWSVKIFACVLAGIMEGTAKNKNAGVTSTKLDFIMQSVTKFSTLLNYGKHVIEIRLLTRRMLDGLSKEILSNLEGEQMVEVEFDKTKFDRFKNDIVDGWREEIRKRSGEIIGKEIISPLLKKGANRLLQYAGGKVKQFYKQYKERRLYQEYLNLKKQYEDERAELGDDVQAIRALDENYWNALDLLSANTCNPKLFAEIIKEGGRLSITCMDPIADEVKHVLQSRGIEDGIEINVERGDARQTFMREGTSGENIVINLMITDKHYVLLDENGQPMEIHPSTGGSSNDCAFHAINQIVDLGMSSNEFRNRIANRFENDPILQGIITNGYHRYGILLGLLGGRSHPYAKAGCWEYDSTKDIDLLGDIEYKDGKPVFVEKSDLELNQHLCEANNLTLEQVNHVLSGRSNVEGWQNVQLLKGPLKPEDFKAVMYDTVCTSGAFGKTAKAYYPVEMEAVVEVKVGRHTVKYIVTLDIDALTRDQKGPQGPHIGYTIKPFQTGDSELLRSQYPKKVVGHCLINTAGNDSVPRRAKPSEGVAGIVYDPEKYGDRVPHPKDLPRIPPRRLFYLPSRTGSRLQRDGSESTRGRSFPSSNF